MAVPVVRRRSAGVGSPRSFGVVWAAGTVVVGAVWSCSSRIPCRTGMPINCAKFRRCSARTAKGLSQLCMRPGSLRGLVAGRLAVPVVRGRRPGVAVSQCSFGALVRLFRSCRLCQGSFYECVRAVRSYSTRGIAMARGQSGCSGSIQVRCSSALPCLLSNSCPAATPDPFPLFANRYCPGTRCSDGRAYCSCSTMSPPSPQPPASAWSGVALRKR